MIIHVNIYNLVSMNYSLINVNGMLFYKSFNSCLLYIYCIYIIKTLYYWHIICVNNYLLLKTCISTFVKFFFNYNLLFEYSSAKKGRVEH